MSRNRSPTHVRAAWHKSHKRNPTNKNLMERGFCGRGTGSWEGGQLNELIGKGKDPLNPRTVNVLCIAQSLTELTSNERVLLRWVFKKRFLWIELGLFGLHQMYAVYVLHIWRGVYQGFCVLQKHQMCKRKPTRNLYSKKRLMHCEKLRKLLFVSEVKDEEVLRCSIDRHRVIFRGLLKFLYLLKLLFPWIVS